MKFEILIQFIVPLMFLAIWALTSLLNRDAQPLPPRPVRAPGSGGTRPMNRGPGDPDPRSSAMASSQQKSAPSPFADPQNTWANSNPARAAQGRAPDRPALKNLDDAIVYIENDTAKRSTTRPATAPGPATNASAGTRLNRPVQQRRTTSNRAGNARQGQGQARVEPKTQRALSDQVNRSMAMQRNKPLEIAPLLPSLAPLSLPLTQASVAPVVQQERGTANPVTMSGEEIRKLLSSPGKLREFALLTEILQPPLALRYRRLRP